MKRVLLLILSCCCATSGFAQTDSIANKDVYFKNNSIKIFMGGMVYGGSIGTISLGYERFISPHSSIDCFAHYAVTASEDSKWRYISIIPSYKYYVQNKRSLINNTWISTFFRYTNYHYGTWDKRFDAGIYGIGVALGKKFYISSNKRFILDIGYGYGYGLMVYDKYEENIYDYGSGTNYHVIYVINTINSKRSHGTSIHRPILHFGYSF